MTIYFVDEDRGPMKPFRAEIAAMGYDVVPVAYAEDAIDRLCGATDVELAIIDVMLGVRSSQGPGPFNPRQTRDGSQTGLVLLQQLIECNPAVFPVRAILITHSTIPEVIEATRAFSRQHHIPWYRKTKFSTPYAFGGAVQDRLNALTSAGST